MNGLASAALGVPWQSTLTSHGRLWTRASGTTARRVVFIHGLGRGGSQLVPLALAFADVRSVLVPDLFDLGGRSVSSRGQLSILEHAEALEQFLEEVGPADVFGISFGGWVASWVAARRPELVDRLFLVNPAGAREDAERIGDLFRETARGDELYRKIVAGRPFVGVPIVSRLLARGFLSVLHTPAVREFVESVRDEHLLDEAVSRIRCPVRLLLSENDQLLNSAATERIFAARGAVEGGWIEGASHNVGYEAFGLLLDELATFFGLAMPPTGLVASVAGHLRVPPTLRSFARQGA